MEGCEWFPRGLVDVEVSVDLGVKAKIIGAKGIIFKQGAEVGFLGKIDKRGSVGSLSSSQRAIKSISIWILMEGVNLEVGECSRVFKEGCVEDRLEVLDGSKGLRRDICDTFGVCSEKSVAIEGKGIFPKVSSFCKGVATLGG